MKKINPEANKRTFFVKEGITPEQLTWNIPFTENEWETDRCVIKLFYGDRYVIVKAKNLTGTLHIMEKGYTSFIAFDHSRDFASTKSEYYFEWYKYIMTHPGLKFRVEIILEDNNPYKLLKQEQILLNESFGKDKKCLNPNPKAYINKRLDKKTGLYGGWIGKGHILSFHRFFKHM